MSNHEPTLGSRNYQNSIRLYQVQLYPCSEVVQDIVFSKLIKSIQGTISDGLLAWRFYVLYERKRWALYAPAVAIAMNTSALT